MEIKKYGDKFRRHQQTLDLMFIGTYLTSTVADAFLTFVNIRNHTEESNHFASFTMEQYGIGEGLLRIQGIEALQLAVLLGRVHIAIEFWKWVKKEVIDMQIRFIVVYVYTMVDIAKHVGEFFRGFKWVKLPNVESGPPFNR
jgi:hypothetical protein